jgi:hypothetical protein
VDIERINSSEEKLIYSKIHRIRNEQVILDRDLAELYGVETRVFNQAVKRNIKRFPKDFMFLLSDDEFKNWKSQIVMSNSDKMGLRHKPNAFTEHGALMCANILKSERAIEVSILIVRAFVHMRRFFKDNSLMFQRINHLEKQQLITDAKLEQVLEAIEDKKIKPSKGIFFDGQIFDAYVFVSKLIKHAEKSITLIDNYIDESVLTMLSKRAESCTAMIYTKNISRSLQLDLKKHNEQYSPIEINILQNVHDRFLIIDNKETYHIGASLKDLGKKWFAFSKFDKDSISEILQRLKK